ncbi:MAG TPA: hypothetical protein VLB50_05110 [Ignavibacteriaceae bacterium]|nr:hypothetical protein [Ignavibacteriaceae bacterium]
MANKVLTENYQSRRDYLTRLIEKLYSREEALKSLSRKYSNYRLLLLVVETAVFFFLFFVVSNTSALISIAVFLAAFAVVAHFHNKLDNGIKKLGLWIKIKTSNLARLNLDWKNIPAFNYSGKISSLHKPEPNETDLNLAGDESLHQLISTGTSFQSRDLLRKWLNQNNPSIEEIITRQKLVKELTPLSLFRDKLILFSILSSRADFDGKMILKLLSRKDILPRFFRLIYIVLILLAPVNILLLLLFLENMIPAYWGITTLIYITLFFLGNKEKDRILDEAEFISDELEKPAAVFQFLEQYHYNNSPLLLKLCESFKTANEQPSVLINKIKNAVGFLRMRKGNPFVWNVIRAIFPVDFYFKLKLNRLKTLVSGRYNSWFETWYNLEALSSLANFAWLNPGYAFPEITDSGQIIFIGKKLGHPLIKKGNKICNDFAFNPEGEIAIITGSNMSGKSTFIRTLGINLSLAYAGSVVNADDFKVSLFNLFTCIKVSDSVIDGISYFYAEVKRLKALLEEIENSKFPVLFLIDEIFRGTNNIERLKGSSSYIKKLAGTRSFGAIATHDLELVKLSDEISRVLNYHFKEEIKDGKMVFDYKLNAGPCPTTNALKIMKLEGLPVDL